MMCNCAQKRPVYMKMIRSASEGKADCAVMCFPQVLLINNILCFGTTQINGDWFIFDDRTIAAEMPYGKHQALLTSNFAKHCSLGYQLVFLHTHAALSG